MKKGAREMEGRYKVSESGPGRKMDGGGSGGRGGRWIEVDSWSFKGD